METSKDSRKVKILKPSRKAGIRGATGITKGGATVQLISYSTNKHGDEFVKFIHPNGKLDVTHPKNFVEIFYYLP